MGASRGHDKFVFGFEGKSSLAKGMLGFQRLFSMELPPTLSRQLHEQLVMHLVLCIEHYTVVILWYGKITKCGTHREINSILQAEDTVKFIKSLQLRMYGHVERMQNQRMPNQISKIKVAK